MASRADWLIDRIMDFLFPPMPEEYQYCPDCGGTGHDGFEVCPHCDGIGIIEKKRA